ncbi:hypothetical protein KBK19_08105 [Microvirga sp. STR05]|uniref:Lipoprotein n=1 Tax=Hymenobacter duratus TaxID=2771356 RepID=A0ABR8JDS0_9BACT|nr:hypothetical protein [Hymenobacter duratus]MBD2714994.1 hypothetical protein [Hymenobacter duratus]MBR7949900.1 hypothetical protein [Microvirga sp. STR05]
MKTRAYSLLASAALFTGCLSTKVPPTESDSALLMLLNNRQLTVTSLSSAIQTNITRQEQKGDTLVLTYTIGAFLRNPSNTVAVAENIRYVRCANQVYRVAAAADGLRLEPL